MLSIYKKYFVVMIVREVCNDGCPYFNVAIINVLRCIRDRCQLHVLHKC